MGAKLVLITLTNFKCFQHHTVYFTDTTIMIGQNNAGKSTVVEALRILGLACARLKNNPTYVNRPDWMIKIEPASIMGVRISHRAIDVDLEHVFYGYNDPPAVIHAEFEDGITIDVYIEGQTELFAVLTVSGKAITSKFKANLVNIPKLLALPQIAPLVKNEQFVTEDTMNKNRFSKRISGNFRSVLYQNKQTENYREFERILEETWHGIKIVNIILEEDVVLMYLRDRDFVTEIYHMGHGVQMWIQTMWFISNADYESIIVLDEPDVYMHADLQRKLIRILKNQYRQTIVATHSVEIMSEVIPNEILIINRMSRQSVFADAYPVLQEAISGMGSIHNINLSRILNCKKYLYVEGDDRDILNIFWTTLFGDQEEPFDFIGGQTTGGWGSWDVQKQNAQRMLSAMPGIMIYFLYDRDMHTEDEILGRYEDAKSREIILHIWQKKEIENYLMVPPAIARYIAKKNGELTCRDVTGNIVNLINQLCEDVKDETYASFVDEYLQKNRKVTYKSCQNKLMPIFNKNWSDERKRWDMVSGKELMSKLSNECKTKYNVSFGHIQIAATITTEEMSPEVIGLLKKIKGGEHDERD